MNTTFEEALEELLIQDKHKTNYVGKLKKALGDDTSYLLSGGDMIEKITWSPENLKARIFFVNFSGEKRILLENCDFIKYPIPTRCLIWTYIEFYDELGEVRPIDDSEVLFTVIRNMVNYKKSHVIVFGSNDTLYYNGNSITPLIDDVYDWNRHIADELIFIPIESVLSNTYDPDGIVIRF